jgi:hypothetical protein
MSRTEMFVIASGRDRIARSGLERPKRINRCA